MKENNKQRIIPRKNLFFTFGGKILFFDYFILMASADTSLPWVEKYRPEGLKDVIAHEDIISTSLF